MKSSSPCQWKFRLKQECYGKQRKKKVDKFDECVKKLVLNTAGESINLGWSNWQYVS